MMRTILIPLLLTALACNFLLKATAFNPNDVDIEDNEFAEFEEFDEEDNEFENIPNKAEQTQNGLREDEAKTMDDFEEEDTTIEDEEEDEFEHLNDEEEFEGFDRERRGRGADKPVDLKINKVPYHLRTSWDSYYMEMLMLAGLGVYLLNFVAGKSKNAKLANAWFTSHKDLLEKHFAVVGDDGQSAEIQPGPPMKESENVYALWCSGRVCVEGMLVTLKLLKRQDLISSIARMLKPACDHIIYQVTLEDTTMDSYVMCVAKRNVCSRMMKDITDLSSYCTDKKGADKYNLPSSFQVLSEIAEASSHILDRQVQSILKKYEETIEFLHISDQYSGVRPADDGGPPKAPETQRAIILGMNLGGKGRCTVQNMEEIQPMMMLLFHLIERVSRFRLSKEAKAKSLKNRQKVEETYVKLTHAQRQEAAQQRREDKRRAEKERIMAEEDPEKQRRMEEVANKRDAKKRQPKVKVMKVM